jgi:Leucine Rich repeat
MRRFALATIPMLLLLGCTRHDEDSSKVIAALTEKLESAEKKLAELEDVVKKHEDARRERLRDPEHRAADWALANGGDLVVRVDDRTVDVHTGGELPIAHFQILEMKFKSNHKIDDGGLDALKGLSHIRTLDLFDTKIGDAGLAYIAPLTTLEGLTLRETQVTDAGVARLTRLTNLQLLDLVGTKVTSTMAKKLQTALPRCKIDTVDKK